MSRNGTSQARVSRTGPGPDVIVFGQIARDLVLVVDTVPVASRSADVYQRRELLGGKGANQAVGLAQLGPRPALAGVVGEDQVSQRLLTQVALAVEDAGNLVAWPDGCVFLPLSGIPVVDTTGAGDAFVAGLITALAQDSGPQRAARLAAAAAGATVGHPGGRPALTPKVVQDQLTLLAESTCR